MTPIKDNLLPELAERIGFETLIAELSSRFVNLPSHMVDSEIEESLRRVCEFLGFELSAFWQWSQEDQGELIMTHVYRPLGGPEIPEPMKASFYFPWILEQMLAGQTVAISSMKEAPAEAARDMEVWEHFGIKTCLALPLSIGENDMIGVISFNTMKAERDWPEHTVRKLQLIGEIFTNAIARKRSDERLRESEERLSLAADSAGAGLWSLNLSSGTFWLTDRTRALFGLSPDETVTFERFVELIHPDDRDSVRDRTRAVIEDPDQAEIDDKGIEYRIIRTDGEVRWLFSKGRVYLLPSGGSDYLMGVSFDITDRKRIEEAARSFSGRLINAYEEERARLARELHDDLTQRLARMAIDAAQLELVVVSPDRQQSVRKLHEDLVSLSEDVHALSYRLHPSMLEDLGLAEAVEAECERVSRLESRKIDVEIDEAVCDMPREAALCLYRITQEALMNAVRHAGECDIAVTVRCLGDSVALTVRDNGAGFDAEKVETGRTLGLTGMRERVQLVDGSIEVDSSPGEGTTVSVRVPVGQE